MSRLYRNVFILLTTIIIGLLGKGVIPYDEPLCTEGATVGMDYTFKTGTEGNWTTLSTERTSYTVTYCLDSQMFLFFLVMLTLVLESVTYTYKTLKIEIKKRR